jgi:hypothetical protein
MRVLRVTWTRPSAAAFMLAAAGVVARLFVLPEMVRAFDATSQGRTGMETYDDLLVRVEQRAPGFGGMFIDSDGRLAVYLLDATQLSAAHSAIEAVFGPNQIPAAGVRPEQGQYSVSQLEAWTKRAGGLLSMSGVTMVDLDDAKNRVTVGIEDRSRRHQVEERLSALGIPRKAVLIEVIGQIRPVTY